MPEEEELTHDEMHLATPRGTCPPPNAAKPWGHAVNPGWEMAGFRVAPFSNRPPGANIVPTA